MSVAVLGYSGLPLGGTGGVAAGAEQVGLGEDVAGELVHAGGMVSVPRVTNGGR